MADDSKVSESSISDIIAQIRGSTNEESSSTPINDGTSIEDIINEVRQATQSPAGLEAPKMISVEKATSFLHKLLELQGQLTPPPPNSVSGSGGEEPSKPNDPSSSADVPFDSLSENGKFGAELMDRHPNVSNMLGDVMGKLRSSVGPNPPEDMKIPDANNPAFASMLAKLQENPEETMALMQDAREQMTPAMAAKAKNMAGGSTAAAIKKAMAKRGIDPIKMKKELLANEKLRKSLGTKKVGEATQAAILITRSRKVKLHQVSLADPAKSALEFFQTQGIPVEMPCSRLAVGPLVGKTIRLWYLKDSGCNKRASALMGFEIGGEVLIVANQHNFSEEQFITLEKMFAKPAQ